MLLQLVRSITHTCTHTRTYICTHVVKGLGIKCILQMQCMLTKVEFNRYRLQQCAFNRPFSKPVNQFESGQLVLKRDDQLQSRSEVFELAITHVIRVRATTECMVIIPHIYSLFSLNVLGIFHICKTY